MHKPRKLLNLQVPAGGSVAIDENLLKVKPAWRHFLLVCKEIPLGGVLYVEGSIKGGADPADWVPLAQFASPSYWRSGASGEVPWPALHLRYAGPGFAVVDLASLLSLEVNSERDV